MVNLGAASHHDSKITFRLCAYDSLSPPLGMKCDSSVREFLVCSVRSDYQLDSRLTERGRKTRRKNTHHGWSDLHVNHCFFSAAQALHCFCGFLKLILTSDNEFKVQCLAAVTSDYFSSLMRISNRPFLLQSLS